MKKITAFLFALISLNTVVYAQQDPEIEQALKLTQEMLKNPDERSAQANKTADGKAANQKVKDIAGSSANEQAIYELAASVFGSMVAETGGDTKKMQQMIAEGMKNPEAFANKWSPEQVKKLEAIAKDTGKETGATATPAPEKSSSRLIVHEPKPIKKR